MFAGGASGAGVQIEIVVHKGPRLVGRFVCPVRPDVEGEAAFYRTSWWPVFDNAIDIAGPRIEASSSAEPAASGPGDVDPAQASVINAGDDARLAVSAGPGTGKTWVACQRVAALVADGVPASRIWMISFTRTAVIEIRQRISASLDDPTDAASVRIATLDSHAWALQSGFSSDAALTGSFDDGIARTAATLTAEPDAAEYLNRLRHLVIDEGQDIVGARADLILAMISVTNSRCGVTVFMDEAQAIYDFTEDFQKAGKPGVSLGMRLRESGFASVALARVYRTNCPRLRAIFTDVRSDVLDTAMRPVKRAERVRSEIIRLAHADAGDAKNFDIATVAPDALVLFRRRAEVLERSSWASGHPHRLRMSGLPARIRPWLAAMFWDATATRFSRQQFSRLWPERVRDAAASGAPDLEAAWALLVETAGESEGSVDLSRLRTLLGRATPPLLFCSPEYGDSGPVLGTIHASKGREADTVHLFLPPADPEDQDPDQETRVAFVGATRARQKLQVGQASRSYAGSTSSHRVWRRGHKPGTGQVEIGRAGDIDASGLVGTQAFETVSDAMESQQQWLTEPVRTGLAARAVESLEWNFEVRAGDGPRLCALDAQVRRDLWEITRHMKQQRSPGFLPHLRSLGLASFVLRPDDPILESLHEPWRSSGFLFAPMLSGFSPFRIWKK